MWFETALLILLFVTACEVVNIAVAARAANRAALIERALRRLEQMYSRRAGPRSLSLDGLQLSLAEQQYVLDAWAHSDVCVLSFGDGREIRWNTT